MVPWMYSASVPVFRHYLDRAEVLVHRTLDNPAILNNRLAPDMFTGAQQFATAAGFSLRVACPLAQQPVPEVGDLGMDHDGLLARFQFARDGLASLTPEDFAGAEARLVSHRAGFAELTQNGSDFLHLFGMPNFFFHLGMGFAVLREGGQEIGKADFDGLHDYPQGFRF